MRIDLHTHSNASDGTDAPARVIADAALAGLDVVALTDHDTTAGWAEAVIAAQDAGISLVRGAEISARSRGVSVHLLGYLHDPDHPEIERLGREAREARETRARDMVAKLSADFPVTWDDVVAQTKPGTVIGRPHLADALVAAGVLSTRSEAFETILTPARGYYVPHYAPDPVEVIGAVLAAGGVPVFAHPGADLRGDIVPDSTIEEMAAAGLAGLEVDHRDNSPAQRVRLRALAAALGLFVTGSSDYHGDGKPNRLGENMTSSEVLAEIEHRGLLKVLRP